MPTEVQDVLKANVVLVGLGLLNNPVEVKAFSDAVGTDVVTLGTGLVVGLPPTAPEPGRRLSLHRDRILLDITPNRTVVEREYPASNDLIRLTEVIELAVCHTELAERLPTAFGYNVELVYNQTSGVSSLCYLGRKLFGKSELGTTDWVLAGGAGTLVFDAPDARWTVRVEPRFNDAETTRTFLTLNLHKAEQRLPSSEEIRQSFEYVWRAAHDFVERLDGSVS